VGQYLQIGPGGLNCSVLQLQSTVLRHQDISAANDAKILLLLWNSYFLVKRILLKSEGF
jgi:hypothetical protein